MAILYSPRNQSEIVSSNLCGVRGGMCGVRGIEFPQCHPNALSKLLKHEGRAGAEGAILPYVGHLQLISTLKIGADCCQLCKYKLTKPNLT